MASTLYQEIYEKAEARVHAETIIQILIHWAGALDADLRARIRAVSDVETLKAWQNEAVVLRDAESAERLAESIRKARLS